MEDLERLLPDDVKRASLASGNELVLPFAEALSAIAIATDHQIAVLGLEAFEVQRDGLLTVGVADASSHLPFTGDWKAYVAKVNAEAECWVKGHRLGENHGYVLTSASQMEFATLPSRVK